MQNSYLFLSIRSSSLPSFILRRPANLFILFLESASTNKALPGTR